MMITNMRQPEQKPDRFRIAIDLFIDFLFEISLEDVEGDDSKREPLLGDSTSLSSKEIKAPQQQ